MGMAEPTTAIRARHPQRIVIIQAAAPGPTIGIASLPPQEAVVGDSVVDMMAGTAAEAEMEEEEASGAVVEEDAEGDSVVVVGEEDAEVTLEEVGEDVIRLTTERERE